MTDELIHFGVKGMKWGVRKDDGMGHIPTKTKRDARKDADEHAKAKMYYGEGAGTRRKLINGRVSSRSKDPLYKEAFDNYSSGQDMAKRGQQARRTRARNDAKNTTAKTARGIKNLAMGNRAPVTIGAVVAFGALSNPTVRGHISRAGKKSYSAVKNSDVFRKGAAAMAKKNW